MRKSCAVVIIATLLLPSLSFAQSQTVRIARTPAWVEPVSFDAKAKAPEGQQSGFYYLLIDDQHHIEKQERFQRYVYRIETTEGIQAMSDIAEAFDPAYQELTFHSVKVHREGKVINQLSPPVRTIQREESMERFLYDGSLTAIIHLSDIRVGDVIEYSLTRKGANPVYDGHFYRAIYFNYSLPYGKLYQRLVTPSGTPLTMEYRNADIKADIRQSQNSKDHRWILHNVNQHIQDENLPAWYDPYQRVLISDFQDWDEVARWATKHFATGPVARQKLKARLPDLLATESDEETYALKATRFVQDEIRYLGFESGLNSHKPHDPLKVFDQRFGDCKDKSLLLCEILRLRGIEAYPVLVSTQWQERISHEIPSIAAFNHCVVQVNTGDGTYYVDPTISSQGGMLDTNYFPPYGMGLVVKEDSPGLEKLPATATSEISEVQTFHVPSLTGEAVMSIRTVYLGEQADYMRGQFLKNSDASMQQGYLNYYSNVYPKLEIYAPIRKEDNRLNNIFTIEEHYRIPDFWKQSEVDGEQMFCEVYPLTLETYFNLSRPSQRTTPFRLTYPVNYHHTTHIKLPEEWNMEPSNEVIDTDHYEYEYNTHYADNEITLQTHYRTRQDFVPVEAFEQFVTDHQKMMNNLTFQLTYNKNLIANEKGISWMAITVGLVSLIGGIWLSLRLYYYYDPLPSTPLQGRAIGGWLILPALGLCITPFRLIADIVSMPEMYDSQMWANLLGLKRYALYVFILLEHVYNMVLIPFTVLIIVLFFKRRSSLPRLITIYFAVTGIVTLLDSVVGLQLEASDADANTYSRDMARAIFAAVIWIPYFNMSTRVKETFVTRVDGDDDNSIYELEPAVTTTTKDPTDGIPPQI